MALFLDFLPGSEASTQQHCQVAQCLSLPQTTASAGPLLLAPHQLQQGQFQALMGGSKLACQ